MVSHQTIGIDIASGRQCPPLIVNVELRLPPKDVKETQVVLFVLKHLLFVYATKYGVINTGGRCHPSLSWHNAWLTIIDE